jgi:hypothetical protein
MVDYYILTIYQRLYICNDDKYKLLVSFQHFFFPERFIVDMKKIRVRQLIIVEITKQIIPHSVNNLTELRHFVIIPIFN